MKMNKLILPMFAILLVVTMIGAGNAEEAQIGVPKNLQFTCTINGQVPSPSTTYNISIYYPNGTILIDNNLTTAQGQGSFNYTALFPEQGTFTIKEFCYDGGANSSNQEQVLVTPSGDSRGFSLMLILALFGAALFCFGYFTHNVWFVYISGIIFLVLGVYVLIYGFNNIRDTFTDVVGYVSLGLGIFFFVVGAYEQLAGEGGEGE